MFVSSVAYHLENKLIIMIITIGKDQCALFPVLVDTCNGVAVSRSNITGKSILSGRAKSTSDTAMMANRTVVGSRESIPQGLSAFSNSAVKISDDNSQDKKSEHNKSTSPTQS